MIACAVLAGLLLPDQVFGPGGDARPHRSRSAAAERHAAKGPKGRAGACGGGAHGAAGCAGGSGGTAGLAAVGLPAAAARVGANELGEVPIIMYHRILAKPMSSLDRTPQELRDELVHLAADGYVPITAADFAAGKIDIPAGTHPVVLTFDDGAPGQFAFDPQGNPTPDSATGVILDVARSYPFFRPVATFFLNADPFALGPRAAEAVRWLVQHGFEVANHTTHHLDLAALGKEGIQREIGTDEKMITDLGAPAPTTFAYPYGALRKSEVGWARQGTADGVSWNFAGMFLAGWKPNVSPFAKDFDPTLIDRIRSDGKIKEAGCDQFCSTAWLEWLDKNPDKRYTSDGDARVISYPAADAGSLAPSLRALGRGY
jgi:peptidoglycan/xylan/chitin deacetylase (PgdA/CDA1 family)